jgi:hypothetical protein
MFVRGLETNDIRRQRGEEGGWIQTAWPLFFFFCDLTWSAAASAPQKETKEAAFLQPNS